jgi:hypothetical protein
MDILRSRLSYANVVATVALFVSLGGASYAAVVLPPHSVGAKQLRDGAVTPSALGFPLSVAGVTNDTVVDLTKGPCNSPPRPGGPFASCPILKRSGIATPGQEVHLRARAQGRLLVSAIVGLRNEGTPATTADVTFNVTLDGRPVGEHEVQFTGGQTLQVPVQALVNIRAGSHTVGLTVDAKYSSNEPGDVLVAPVSLIATMLPAGG